MANDPGRFLDLFTGDSSAFQRPEGVQGAGPSRILDFLYLGSISDAQDQGFLTNANVKLIVNLSAEGYWLEDSSIVVVRIDVSDRSDTDILPVIKRCLPHLVAAKDRWSATQPRPVVTENGFVESTASRGPSVLVHCQKGISRSATIVCAYLMHQNGWSVSEALDFVRRKRPQVEPNMGFMVGLQQYYEELTESGSEKYDRASLVQKRILLMRNVDTSRDDTLAQSLEVFGDVHRIERRGQLVAVHFASRYARRLAQEAINASRPLRLSLSGTTATPVQLVPLPVRSNPQ